MKRVILSLLAATALVGTAAAADLPSRRQAPPAYIPPVFTWTGFYAGINAGYAFNSDDKLRDADYNYINTAGVAAVGNFGNDFFNTARKSDEASFTGGAQIGYNYQMGSIVLGIEADINYAALEKTYYANYTTASGAIWDEAAIKSKTEWYGTVRPRIGFTPMDRLMVYVTGGLAYGQVKSSGAYYNYFGNYGFAGSSKTDTRVGWTVGAGVEYAVTNNITVRGEYAYVDLGDKNYTLEGRYVGNSLVWKDETAFHVVRAGVNYKF